MSCLGIYSDAEPGAMNENVGATFGLSALVVVFFAIALYQPETGRATKKYAHASARSELVQPHTPAPALTPTIPPQTIRPGQVASDRRLTPRMAKGPASSATMPRPTIVAARRVEVNDDVPRTAPGPFTEARSGETLEDVARRVYGSGRAADSLRKANRDLVRDDGVPLVAGALIRTP
jgi:hypothetical protein